MMVKNAGSPSSILEKEAQAGLICSQEGGPCPRSYAEWHSTWAGTGSTFLTANYRDSPSNLPGSSLSVVEIFLRNFDSQ